MTGDLTRWRKKPVEIEAMRWDGSRSSIQDICDWANTDLTDDPCVTYEFHGGDDVVGNPIIGTLEGDMTVSPGDWIIRVVNGEFYPCKPDIFEATYERVLDADPDTPTTEHEVDAVDLRKWLAGETARALPQLNGFEVADALLPYVLERLSLEYAEGFSAGSRPDAPVDDGLVEQIAEWLHLRSHVTGSCGKDDPRRCGLYVGALQTAEDLVVARPWQAEVER